MKSSAKTSNPVLITEVPDDYFRFHLPHLHLGTVFGNNWFALKAEAFARFLGLRYSPRTKC
jgi:hypothetical protein